jgi:hypothetical protein
MWESRITKVKEKKSFEFDIGVEMKQIGWGSLEENTSYGLIFGEDSYDM